MKNFILITSLILFAAACTKEIPENEKKSSKSPDEKIINDLLENYFSSINSDNIGKAVLLVDADYREISSDGNNIIGTNSLQNFLNKQTSSMGKWKIKVEETNVSGEFAFVISEDTFISSNSNLKNHNSAYTIHAIRIMKKQKNDGWKIFRCVTTSVEGSTESI
jgi:hypothetical protein